MVGIVAIGAADAVQEMGRALVVAMFLGVLMATETAGACLLRGGVFEGKYFGFISAPIHVFFSRTMAGFTSVPLGALVRFELALHGGGEVRRGFKLFVDFIVTGLAGFGTDIQRRVRRADVLFPQVGLILVLVRRALRLCGTEHRGGNIQECQRDQHESGSQSAKTHQGTHLSVRLLSRRVEFPSRMGTRSLLQWSKSAPVKTTRS